LDRRRGFSFFIRERRGKPDTVIVPGVDLSIVKKEGVCKRTKAVPCLFIVLGDRFFRDVSACHDQGMAHGVQKEMVEGCIRQHDSQIPVSRGNIAADRRFDSPLQKHNGAGRTSQQFFFASQDHTVLMDLVQGGHHHGKGLLRAALSFPKGLHGTGVCRIAGEMKTAEPFEGENRSRAE
jgi:hypothetical protein